LLPIQGGSLSDPHTLTLAHINSHTRIIEGRNQIMLELRLIFYSILMRQTKADKQTPTPTSTAKAESTLILVHTCPLIPVPCMLFPCPSCLALGPMGRWQCFGSIYPVTGCFKSEPNTWPWPLLLLLLLLLLFRWLGRNYNSNGTWGSNSGLGRCWLSTWSLWETF